MFIELTIAINKDDNQRKLMISTDHIVSYSELTSTPYGATAVTLTSVAENENDCYYVVETVSEITKLIEGCAL